ncbi:FAD binding domain-containing protein [Frankia sp. CNm7]|uniref:FAD binding domain-containing protein n=1 Tax=Frankia nepalensis TaxID=1836974 RepID=A0A937RGL3_9ACTN|nr:FAD binding domain-containing protein [Frankia nepalensis]MBL7498811.1 FAD binding domain-containing protein [Frankia nepalensis]MBL7508616.1 FAD binding domain-containing protein [Frankia nepalensis]MBL7517466.1 FAD binding domain-containing protein [Frankia nepalensis]MBL7629712.1 FAD binding domain-containing protein [Frankia nepalensis]
MKPAAFDYVAPRTVAEAVDALGTGGRRAQVLAGGQSLILEMRLERIRPDLVVDINRIPALDELRVRDGTLRVGALVRHRAFESAHAVPGPLGALFARAVGNIAHPPIRARGTMVGSVAWAHPASEWCAIAVALDADVEMAGPRGARNLAAGDFFQGPLKTAGQPGELITSVRYPLLGDDTGVGFVEHRRTHFCFAQVAAAAALTARGGVISEARIGLVNCADRPLRAHAAEAALTGVEIGPPLDGYRLPENHPFARAGRIAAERDAAPVAEPYADLEYRGHAIAVVVARTLCQAASDQRSRARALEGESR